MCDRPKADSVTKIGVRVGNTTARKICQVYLGHRSQHNNADSRLNRVKLASDSTLKELDALWKNLQGPLGRALRDAGSIINQRLRHEARRSTISPAGDARLALHRFSGTRLSVTSMSAGRGLMLLWKRLSPPSRERWPRPHCHRAQSTRLRPNAFCYGHSLTLPDGFMRRSFVLFLRIWGQSGGFGFVDRGI